MSAQGMLTDGSAEADAPPRVEIDRSDELERMRYRCPNNHTRWVPTNNHIYCHSCAALEGVAPEYWELYDAKTDTTIEWPQVILR